ncbi:MAG: DNA-binding protein [Bacteroidota bacterium]
MNITFQELRRVKHSLPTGSIKRIAKELQIEEQTVRNYFGAQKYESGKLTGRHVQPGPDGGIVSLKDSSILEAALKIIGASRVGMTAVVE